MRPVLLSMLFVVAALVGTTARAEDPGAKGAKPPLARASSAKPAKTVSAPKLVQSRPQKVATTAVIRDVPKRPRTPLTINRPPKTPIGITGPGRPLPPILKRPTPLPPIALPKRPPVLVLPLPPVTLRPDPSRPPAVTYIPLIPPVRPLPPFGPGGTPPPAQQTPPVGGTPPAIAALATFVPDEVLISLPIVSPETVEADVAQAFNLTIVERAAMFLVDQRLVRLRIPDRRAVPAVVAALQGDARVPAAQPNYIYRNRQGAIVQPTAATAVSSMQYALAKIGLGDSQRSSLRGRGATVAVIDSGIERQHPDFANLQIDELDVLDLGASGLLDPHGTGVAGIIVGRGLVQGVSPDARILSVRAFGNAETRGSATAITSAIVKGLNWSVQRGAQVINMSFSGVRDPAMERNIAALPARRVIAIAAAGNDGARAAPAYPAAYPEVIAVTATDAADKLYEKANQGGYIALAAPGVDVLVPAGRGEHELQSGTSFAAPHVAGIVALMLEANPDLSSQTVRQLLTGSVDDLGRPGPDEQFGAGRINAAKAIAAAAAFKAVLAEKP